MDGFVTPASPLNSTRLEKLVMILTDNAQSLVLQNVGQQ